MIRSTPAVLFLIFLGSAALLMTVPARSAPKQSQPPSPTSIDLYPDAPKEINEAEAAITKGNWSAARSRLDPWLGAHPTDPRALFDAGYVASSEDRLDDAAGLYRRAILLDPKAFRVHLALGLLLARQGKTVEARPELVLATDLEDPGPTHDLMATAWRALALIDQPNDPAAASADLIHALKLSPETSADTLMAASLAEGNHQLDVAEAAYQRALKQNPKSTDAQAGMAHLLILQKKYPEAETLLRDALVQTPEDPTLTAQLAAVLVAEDKAEALPLLRKLHAAHPDDENIDRMLAEVLATYGDPSGSDEIYKRLLATRPEDVDLLLAHARNLVRQFQYTAAFAIYQKTTQLTPHNPDAWSGLAFAAERTHQSKVTLQALDMRAKYLPENASSYFLRATAYDTLHQRGAAVKNYHQFLEASAGKDANQEWQAKQRLKALEQ